MRKDQRKQDDLRIDTEVYPKFEGKILATKHRFRCECNINVDNKGTGVGTVDWIQVYQEGYICRIL